MTQTPPSPKPEPFFSWAGVVLLGIFASIFLFVWWIEWRNAQSYQEHASVMRQVIPAAVKQIRQPEWSGVDASLLMVEEKDRVYFHNLNKRKNKYLAHCRPGWDVLLHTPSGQFYRVSIESEVNRDCVGAMALSCANITLIAKVSESEVQNAMASIGKPPPESDCPNIPGTTWQKL